MGYGMMFEPVPKLNFANIPIAPKGVSNNTRKLFVVVKEMV
jgi:hypothetical protein